MNQNLAERTMETHEGLRSDSPLRPSYAERTLRLGPNGALAGVLCEGADVSGEKVIRPIFVLWNVGLNHRVGPYRIYVELARSLAAQGFSSIRFDLSGLGDSESARGGLKSDAERAVEDVRAVIDQAEDSLGYRGSVLVGFCSSVDSAHATSVLDPRVVGLVNIEGYSFPSEGQRRRYPLRLLDANRWARYLYHRNKARERKGSSGEEPAGSVFQREYPSAPRLAGDYRGLAARDVRVLCVYVRGDSNYEYRDQLFDALEAPELRSHVEVEFYPRADHIFSRVDDRKLLIERIVRFARDHF